MTNAFIRISAFLRYSSSLDLSLGFPQTSHARTPTAAPPKCAADETELIPAFRSRVPMILEQNPKNENKPGRQSNPTKPVESPPDQESKSHPWKIQCVKCNDASNAAAGADAWCLRARIKSDMRQVTDECCQRNEREIRIGWRGTSVSTSCASNQTIWQCWQTSTLIFA